MSVKLVSTITVERPTRRQEEVRQEEPHPQKVGYWYNKEECRNFPMPKARLEKWPGQDDFLTFLDAIQNMLMERYVRYLQQEKEWYETPRHLRGAKAERDHTVEEYRGYSTCRCCSMSNGKYEFNFHGWTWPEGYMHYLRDHNVLPDEGFRQFIMNYNSEV